MNSKKILVVCAFTLLCLLCMASVTATENNTNITMTSINDNGDELQVINQDEVISSNIDDKLDAKKVGGSIYDKKLEINVNNVTVPYIHKEIFVYDKKGVDISGGCERYFLDKDISIRLENLDYDENDYWSVQYPANLKITFNVYKNGAYVSQFFKISDAYGYVNFSTTKLPNVAGVYTIVATYTENPRARDNTGELYLDYLPTEKTFTVTKNAPTEHIYKITSYWGNHKYSVTVKLTDKQYQALKTAKKNKKTKSISGIHTKTYISVKQTSTKTLVIYKITQNKKTGKIKETWTKNWKSKTKKLTKQGYKSQLHKKLSKYNGKIWITFKKTYTKKYEIKASVSTIAKNGQYKKGDYVSLYGPEPMSDINIKIV